MERNAEVKTRPALGRDFIVGESKLLRFPLWDEAFLSVQTDRANHNTNPCGKTPIRHFRGFFSVPFFYCGVCCLQASIESNWLFKEKLFSLVATDMTDKRLCSKESLSIKAILFKLVWCHATSYLFPRTKWGTQLSTCPEVRAKCVFASRYANKFDRNNRVDNRLYRLIDLLHCWIIDVLIDKLLSTAIFFFILFIIF